MRGSAGAALIVKVVVATRPEARSVAVARYVPTRDVRGETHVRLHAPLDEAVARWGPPGGSSCPSGYLHRRSTAPPGVNPVPLSVKVVPAGPEEGE
jgi:hypothetical protein